MYHIICIKIIILRFLHKICSQFDDTGLQLFSLSIRFLFLHSIHACVMGTGGSYTHERTQSLCSILFLNTSLTASFTFSRFFSLSEYDNTSLVNACHMQKLSVKYHHSFPTLVIVFKSFLLVTGVSIATKGVFSLVGSTSLFLLETEILG